MLLFSCDYKPSEKDFSYQKNILIKNTTKVNEVPQVHDFSTTKKKTKKNKRENRIGNKEHSNKSLIVLTKREKKGLPTTNRIY